MALYQHPKFNERATPETRVRVRTDDPERIKELEGAGYTRIPDDDVALVGGPNLDDKTLDALRAMGIETPADAAAVPDEELKKVKGVGDKTVGAIREQQ